MPDAGAADTLREATEIIQGALQSRPEEIPSLPEQAREGRALSRPEESPSLSEQVGVTDTLRTVRVKDKKSAEEPDVVAKAASASAHVVVSPAASEAAAVQQPRQDAVSAVSPEAASARSDAIVETVNKIVESVAAEISVTPSIAKGEETVHITLKPTVLDGSEIALSAKDGTLTVAIVPATSQAERTAAAALPRLETALAEHIPAFQKLVVVVKKGKSNETA